MKKFKILVLLISISLSSFSVHKYYLSLTQIDFKSETKTVQITINVFMDDIETAINKDYNIDLQLTSKNELVNNDIYFKKYLKDKLLFKINQNIKSYTYLGKEYEGDLVYFYLEIKDVATIKNFSITNKILLQHCPKQQNLVKYNIGKQHKSTMLNKDNQYHFLAF